jgi:hypothetical protein
MSFGGWLLKQKKRDDRVGDLARDFIDDKRDQRRNGPHQRNGFSRVSGPYPRGSNFKKWYLYLSRSDAKEAFVEAFVEWIEEQI